MSTESRKKKHKEELTSLIVDSAVEIISESGYENFTMRELAGKINYSPRTIYLYFKNKEDLLSAVIEKVFTETLTAMTSVNPKAITGEEVFSTMINRHIRNAMSRPNLYRAVISGISRDGWETGPAEREFNEKIQQLFESRITEKMKGKSKQVSEIVLTSLRSTGLMMINKVSGLKEQEIKEMISLYTEIILRGIL